jgi:hypothetical protein
MADFLNTVQQNTEIASIFKEAKSEIIIVSPYIKLPNHLKDALRPKVEDDKVHLKVVFGKNEEDVKKSLGEPDLLFFKSFRNVEIYYESRLHAKYYGNEQTGLSTSMNLYDYSSNNNKEIGILVKNNMLLNINDKLGAGGMGLNIDNLFGQLQSLVNDIISTADLKFRKVPHYTNGIVGFGRKYTESSIELDLLPTSVTPEQKPTYQAKAKPISQSAERAGYCIRSGKPIPFNPEKPLNAEAFKSWNKYGDINYPEKFCHFSGEASNGKTCVAKPILNKNWNLAKAYIE